jgi:hypothetical protein
MAAQLPDTIYLNSKWMDLFSNPLETYWEKTGKRKPDFSTLETCKRGYIASWAIKDNKLLLTEVDGEYNTTTFLLGRKLAKTSVKKLFPKSKGNVFAIWFSGKLRIPAGSMTQYEHDNYNSRFEKEIIITIEKGKVLKMVTLDYTQQRLVVNLENIL